MWVRGRGGWGGNLDEKFTALGCGDLVERLAEVIPDEFTPQLHQKVGGNPEPFVAGSSGGGRGGGGQVRPALRGPGRHFVFVFGGRQ